MNDHGDPTKLESIEEIAQYVRDAYRAQRQAGMPGGTTPKLALAAARPSPLIERAIELSGSAGITAAALRRHLAPIAVKRYEGALWQLESAGMIVRSLERRLDKRGTEREQIVWRTAGQADPRGGG
jgi:hypothetical protein